jgi:hypothetical protein
MATFAVGRRAMTTTSGHQVGRERRDATRSGDTYHPEPLRGWELAGLAITHGLATTVFDECRGHVARPLRRLVANLEAEARAARP